MNTGHQAFVGDLASLGIEAQVADGLVIYEIEAVRGAHAGAPVRTGVATAELQRWPAVPPHWVHLPDTVLFSRTNTQASLKSGWTAHSRNLEGWGSDANRARAWIAHVRAVVGMAVS